MSSGQLPERFEEQTEIGLRARELASAVLTAVHRDGQSGCVGVDTVTQPSPSISILLQLHHLVCLGQQHPLLGSGVRGPGAKLLNQVCYNFAELSKVSWPPNFRNREHYEC